MRVDTIKLAGAALFIALFAQGFTTSASSENLPSEASGVDCSNAPEDLSRLEHEKTSTAERIEKGVTSIMPIGLVVKSVAGTENQDLEMASGDYDAKIDERIAEIKQTCNIQ